MYTMSKKELELMEIFWKAEEPLARAEILERAEEAHCTWKPTSIHILLNSLLNKGAVRVTGFYLNSRKLGRTFEAAITRRGYAVMQVSLALHGAEDLAGMSEKSVMQELHKQAKGGAK